MIDVVVLKDETRAVRTRATRTRTPRPCSEFQEETRQMYVASRVFSRGKKRSVHIPTHCLDMPSEARLWCRRLELVSPSISGMRDPSGGHPYTLAACFCPPSIIVIVIIVIVIIIIIVIITIVIIIVMMMMMMMMILLLLLLL